jgi:bifunctional non-homologous end joining protein LigD
MLLTAVDHLIDRPNVSAEIKWDGFRGIIYGDERLIISRQQRNLTTRFPELADVIEHFRSRHAIVDGEVVAFVNGLPDFGALQGRRTRAVYVAFDLLAIDGAETTALPLATRRELLTELIGPDSDRLIRSRPFASPTALLAEAEARGLEGIVTKDDTSPYVPGPRRTRYWLKKKTEHGRRAEQVRQQTWGHNRGPT